MSWRLPDGLLDHIHEWQNRNDRISFERAFKEGDLEERKMALALTFADPSTPENFIRQALENDTMTPRSGYPAIPPTLEDVFSMSPGLPGDNSMARQAGAH